ncbi:MAG: endonuclease MutS2 [Flavobacteriaceae bacterium]
MKKIAQKTLDDLEFGSVLEQAAMRCATESGKAQMRTAEPFTSLRAVQGALNRTNEYLISFSEEKQLPNHGFEEVSQEISLLSIENSKIEIEGFRKLLLLADTANKLLVFLKKNKDSYPSLYEAAGGQMPIKEIPTEITRIIDKFGEVKDRASDKLFSIRRQMNGVRSKISQSFGAALSTYQGSGFLDEIRETVMSNRRVLAVKAMYRRKVKGVIHGSSKTGSIVYIEPETTLQYTQELQNLIYDEKEEVDAILRALTDFMRPFSDDFLQFAAFLTLIDTHAAKAHYAKEMNAVMPILSEHQEIDLKKAYHPLLYLSNKQKKNTTYPQDVHLHLENRIMVISGPNAGGKSITLKTIGLLQLMLQSGFLIPVDAQSHVGVFERILTDIGDNQSIENELSTYSYRLKNMQRFLKKCDANTLFLIDEFGTGSDPELGGALAEIFLEVFYERESFGAITTHYSNLKLLANELPHMTNANMQFDGKSLQPTFHLVTGEAGSSFTFEVAEKNGIPYSLINRAKKKIERGKVRFDATIAKLQKERASMTKTNKALQESSIKNQKENEKLETLNAKVKQKLERYQELFDQEQRMIVLGNKVNDAAERYFVTNKKRPLIAELLRIVETENAKRKRKSAAEHKKEQQEKKKLKAEVTQKVEVVREEKKKKATEKPKEKPRPKVDFKIGDKVRMFDGKAVGTIDTLEKKKAIVNYGVFTTQVNVEALELVSRAKK